MNNASRPGFGASNAGVASDKQEASSPEHQKPGLWKPPPTGSKTLSGDTLSVGRRSSSDACASRSLVIDPLDSILAEEPESPSPRWDYVASTAALPSPSPDLTPTPSPGAKPFNYNNNSSSSPCVAKIRRPDSESQCPRPSIIFSPDSGMQDDGDFDDVPTWSRIKPPDPTPAGESQDGTGGVMAKNIRRTSSAPIGRTKW
ncbi:hypothetical protein VMCG_02455 [Cytospora schulzeri]|uniref:Uncharacterized protein n=1 Tax=Cytospora schulzeri TaxID=448051 RepID=A0A423X1G0_9PEZI|nr:hypothetical protein VMCG_02455 [Valsa malicola]